MEGGSRRVSGGVGPWLIASFWECSLCIWKHHFSGLASLVPLEEMIRIRRSWEIKQPTSQMNWRCDKKILLNSPEFPAPPLLSSITSLLPLLTLFSFSVDTYFPLSGVLWISCPYAEQRVEIFVSMELRNQELSGRDVISRLSVCSDK